MTHRKIKEYWTETKQIVNGEVKQTTCCCAAPGAKAKDCAFIAGNRLPCRCDCHRRKLP